MTYKLPCTIMRGGTSKGIYILEKDLPPAGEERDRLLLRLMGSPDLRQIDGLGGATSVTSKVAIIAPSSLPDADVNYTFAQVSVDKAVVSYAGNCGNISSGVGPFAVESGLVKAADGETRVRINNTNTRQIIVSHVQTPGGVVAYEGDCVIAGVPGSAAPVKLSFEKPAGSVTGVLLPTGHASELLDVPGLGPIRVSLVDAANPLVFVLASDIGMRGNELPAEIDGNPQLLACLESIRAAAAVRLGFITSPEESAVHSPGVPKLTILSPASDYFTTEGRPVHAGEIDLTGRMMSMQKAHETYALTGVICTVCASVIPGTIVHDLSRDRRDPRLLRIGHPGGFIEAGVEFALAEDGGVDISKAYSYRTANLLMSGTAFIRV